MIALFDQKTWWFLSRSAGIVAMVLLIASLVWGVLLVVRFKSTRMVASPRPAWTLEVHKWLSGLVFCAVVLHLVGLYLDDYLTFGPRQLFVPGESDYRPTAVAIGVVSLYGLFAVQATAMLRRFLPRRLWRGVHLVSYLVAWGGLMHAGLAGTDTRHRLYQVLSIAMAVVLVVAVIVRLVAPGRGARRTKTARSAALSDHVTGEPTPADLRPTALSPGEHARV